MYPTSTLSPRASALEPASAYSEERSTWILMLPRRTTGTPSGSSHEVIDLTLEDEDEDELSLPSSSNQVLSASSRPPSVVLGKPRATTSNTPALSATSGVVSRPSGSVARLPSKRPQDTVKGKGRAAPEHLRASASLSKKAAKVGSG